jgi:hypothetical protein
MRWVGHVVACVREVINAYNILVIELEEIVHFRDLGIDGRIKLKHVLHIYESGDGSAGAGLHLRWVVVNMVVNHWIH